MPSAYRFLSEWKIDEKINKNLVPMANQLAFTQGHLNKQKKCYGCGLINHTLRTFPNFSKKNKRGNQR